jgi:hypothetical protein
MIGSLTINQLARRDNLVVQLDASPGTYTAYPFNSGSQSGVSSSILTWSNRWTDLSGNNNHAYAVKNMGSSAYQVITYNSGGCPLSSSYLANSIFINLFSDGASSGLRLNPLIESTGPMSLFVWVRPRVDITGASSVVVLDKRKQDGEIGGEPAFAQYIMTWNPNTGFAVGVYYNINGALAQIGPMGGVPLLSTTFYNVGFTLSNNTSGSTLTGYLNGVAQGTVTLPGDMVYANKQVIIGRRNVDTSNRAAMDFSQFLIYNVCLTPQEVWNNYQITKYKHQA